MGRKAIKFSEHGVQAHDFKWTRNMTKKDRGECKTFIDGLLSDVEKRDREILSMSGVMKKQMKDSKESLIEMKKLKDKELRSAQIDFERIAGLYHRERDKNGTLSIVAIICALAAIAMGICLFI